MGELKSVLDRYLDDEITLEQYHTLSGPMPDRPPPGREPGVPYAGGMEDSSDLTYKPPVKHPAPPSSAGRGMAGKGKDIERQYRSSPYDDRKGASFDEARAKAPAEREYYPPTHPKSPHGKVSSKEERDEFKRRQGQKLLDETPKLLTPDGYSEETPLGYAGQSREPTSGKSAGKEAPEGRVGGGGGGTGKAKAKPNIGLDLRKQLSFLPDALRPQQDGYLAPDYEDKLEEWRQSGKITGEEFLKAKKVVREYNDKSVVGTQLRSARSTRASTDLQFADEAAIADREASDQMEQATRQLQLVQQLETSGVLEEAANRKSKKIVAEQISLIRDKIKVVEQRSQNEFSPSGWNMMFAVIADGLSGAGSVLTGGTGQTGGAVTAVMQQIDRQMKEFESKSTDLKFGIQGEFDILNHLRGEIKDDALAASAARGMLINRVAIEVEAMGLMSAGKSTKMRAQQIAQQLRLQGKAEEDKLLAQITAQAEAEKARLLNRGRGSAGKVKKNALYSLQADGRRWSDPVKGQQLITLTGFNGRDGSGFVSDAIAKEHREKQNGINTARNSLNTLRRLHKQGGILSAGDRQEEEMAIYNGMLGVKSTNALGALDNGSIEVGSAFLPEVLGPWTNMPGIMGEVGKKLDNAERVINERQQSLNDAVLGGQYEPGKTEMWDDIDTGKAKPVNIYTRRGKSRARDDESRARQGGNQVRTGATNPQKMK